MGLMSTVPQSASCPPPQHAHEALLSVIKPHVPGLLRGQGTPIFQKENEFLWARGWRQKNQEHCGLNYHVSQWVSWSLSYSLRSIDCIAAWGLSWNCSNHGISLARIFQWLPFASGWSMAPVSGREGPFICHCFLSYPPPPLGTWDPLWSRLSDLHLLPFSWLTGATVWSPTKLVLSVSCSQLPLLHKSGSTHHFNLGSCWIYLTGLIHLTPCLWVLRHVVTCVRIAFLPKTELHGFAWMYHVTFCVPIHH